jgi:NAD(P)H dehydrogenase (quinone)
MKVLVILGHPSIQSFNHAIAARVNETLIKNGHQVFFHDLYAENFDPLMPALEISKYGLTDETIKKHCEELANCDGLVIIHPNWWGMPPAILAGWVDRVIRPGIAYKFIEGDSGEGVPLGLLKAKTALVINTSDTEEKREMEIFGDPLELIWKNCIFDLCGVKEIHRKIFRIVVTSTFEERERWLAEACNFISNYLPESKV